MTSPGRNVDSVATDRGVLRRNDGVLRVAAVAAGTEPRSDRISRFVASCGWDVEVAREVEELAALDQAEVLALRRYDPEGLFLAGG